MTSTSTSERPETGPASRPDLTPAANAQANANIAQWVADHAEDLADRPSIKQGDVVLSFAALNTASARMATLLKQHDVSPGDRVAIIIPNVVYFPIVYYAILRIGAVVVPMNPLLKAGEVAYAFKDAGAKVSVTFAPFADASTKAAEQTGTDVIVVTPGDFDAQLAALEPSTEVVLARPEDTAVILYTSGTTGQPKGAELTHHNLSSNVKTNIETLMPSGPGDVLFGGLPLFHVFGQTCGLNTAVYGGSCLSLLPKFDAEEALRIVTEDAISIFLGVPTMYVGLLNVADSDRFDVSKLKLCASGGASLPVEVLHGIEKKYKVTVLEGYGLSETSPVASFNRPDRPTKPGTIGLPIRGCEMKVVNLDDNEVPDGEIGEIVIRGENIMKGYWGRPDATAEAIRNGWFHSGDLATRDSDGFFTIVDRKKDMIIRNGFNVYPREVEEVIYTHPDVVEAAVLGIPHPEHGEEIAALVTLRPGATVTEDELRAWIKEQIAAYKYPRVVRFGELPKGPTGKILKREITIEA